MDKMTLVFTKCAKQERMKSIATKCKVDKFLIRKGNQRKRNMNLNHSH